MESQVIKALNWRYATKKFDPSKKVSDEDLNELLEVLRLAPSSWGLQPWKFIVVTNPELRKKLREHAWGQPQVTDASHLIVLAARTDLDEKYVKEYVKEISKQRGVSLESVKGYEDMMTDFVKGTSKEELIHWAKKQVYLALGMLLEAAALKHIDACPMEGFDAQKFDEVLELKNLTAAVLCTIGYRSPDDPASKLEKVRFKDVFLRF